VGGALFLQRTHSLSLSSPAPSSATAAPPALQPSASVSTSATLDIREGFYASSGEGLGEDAPFPPTRAAPGSAVGLRLGPFAPPASQAASSNPDRAVPPPRAAERSGGGSGSGGTPASPPSPAAPPLAPFPSRSQSRTRAPPVQDHLVAAFHAALQKLDEAGAAAQLARAPGLANAASLKTGELPLFVAVRVKSLPLVQLLVVAGADVAALDKAGRTAAGVARADGATGMAAWLEGAAARAPSP
jgi:hypothetical protein